MLCVILIDATHWRYSSAREYEGIEGLIDVEKFW